MGDIEEAYRNRIAALLHAFQATTFVRADNVPSKIEQGLFLGSLGAACNKTKLKSLGITHVLTVANAIKPPYPDDFVCKKIDVADREETNLAQHFDECFEFIDEARKTGGGVLVHCFAGRSRSVTIVVAYLMKEHRITASEALGRVKSKRPHAAPNAGFLSQLRNFESALGVTEDEKKKQLQSNTWP